MIARTRQKCWAATYRGIFPDEAIDAFDFRWHTDRDEMRLAKSDFFYHLVMDGQSCVGYLSYGVFHEGFRLQSLYLLPDYQGRGLGKRLMGIAFDACKEMGFDKLRWDCSPHNTKAMGFYAHMGGRVIGIDVGHENRQEDGCTFEYCFT
ncbi:MAG: GNAT family N-acetyltransferase [Oscillospiraceae bacterium]|nr:GNAT family N-acetyltransferase [Oscillospiraceae bacterium]